MGRVLGECEACVDGEGVGEYEGCADLCSLIPRVFVLAVHSFRSSLFVGDWKQVAFKTVGMECYCFLSAGGC